MTERSVLLLSIPIGLTVGHRRYQGELAVHAGIVSVYTAYGYAARPAGKSPLTWVAQALIREIIEAAQKRGELRRLANRPFVT